MKGSVPMTTTGLRLGIKAHNKCGRVYPVLETSTPPGHSCYDTNKHLFSNFQTYFSFWSSLYNNINFLGQGSPSNNISTEHIYVTMNGSVSFGLNYLCIS